MSITTPSSQLYHRRQDQETPRCCEWSFTLSSTISPQAPSLSDALGALALDPTDRLLATGGLSRKIRFYPLNSATATLNLKCDFYICTPAKLSTLRWRPDSLGRTIASADYDGVVTEYDLERRAPVFERDEHGGRRIWSLDFSPSAHLAASASDDGTAQLWDPRNPNTSPPAALVDRHVPVCSVEFDKDERRPYNIALGCADKCAYLYDLRSMACPVAVFAGHGKTVTYVRFAKDGKIITSSVDGCHRLWDARGDVAGPTRVYRGHCNERSFVGMGVYKGGGLIGSGSESNEVFVYDLRWGEPIWVQGFGDKDENQDGGGFVSAVCWREVSEDECALVAGGSNGVVKIFVGRRKEELL